MSHNLLIFLLLSSYRTNEWEKIDAFFFSLGTDVAEATFVFIQVNAFEHR